MIQVILRDHFIEYIDVALVDLFVKPTHERLVLSAGVMTAS